MNTRKTRRPARPPGGRSAAVRALATTHKARSRIPDSLWTAAVKMAGTYGLHRTARALRVEYYSLKKRVEQPRLRRSRGRHESRPDGHIRCPHLPNWPRTCQRPCDCMLELEDAAGSKMRVHLKAAAPPDLAALCRSFWNPAP